VAATLEEPTLSLISDPRLPEAAPEAGSPASSPAVDRDGLVAGAGQELLDDGQEEVFSYSAVEAGEVADPRALGPEDLQRAPKSPGSLRAQPRSATKAGPG
jgi:hypothetical protein